MAYEARDPSTGSPYPKEEVLIKASEIKKTAEIAKGKYGTVYKGECRGQTVAIKMFHDQHKAAEKLQELTSEVAIMVRLRHPCILLFMGICTDPGNICIVMEYVEGRSLDHILNNSSVPLSNSKKIQIAKDIAKGINWLHRLDPPIIHRDLKPANILVGGNLDVKICDFGLSYLKEEGNKSKKKQDDDGEIVGTPLYIAPEVWKGEQYTEKCDVYAYGILLWQILTRRTPFKGINSFNAFLKKVVEGNYRPELPTDISPSLKILVEECWNPSPNRRPSFQKILDKINEEITVESSISDSLGREFWNLLYDTESVGEGYPTCVRWDDFIGELAAQVELQPLQPGGSIEDHPGCLCVQAHLAEKHKNFTTDRIIYIVKCEEFGNFLKCFGPLDVDERPSIIEKFYKVCSTPWFWGTLSSVDSEIKISGDAAKKKEELRPGTFLVRLSSNKQEFTITKVTNEKQIVHQRVRREGLDYVITVNNEERKKKGLIELIESVGTELCLKYPVPESPFEAIITEAEKKAKGGKAALLESQPGIYVETDIAADDNNNNTTASNSSTSTRSRNKIGRKKAEKAATKEKDVTTTTNKDKDGANKLEKSSKDKDGANKLEKSSKDKDGATKLEKSSKDKDGANKVEKSTKDNKDGATNKSSKEKTGSGKKKGGSSKKDISSSSKEGGKEKTGKKGDKGKKKSSVKKDK